MSANYDKIVIFLKVLLDFAYQIFIEQSIPIVFKKIYLHKNLHQAFLIFFRCKLEQNFAFMLYLYTYVNICVLYFFEIMKIWKNQHFYECNFSFSIVSLHNVIFDTIWLLSVRWDFGLEKTYGLFHLLIVLAIDGGLREWRFSERKSGWQTSRRFQLIWPQIEVLHLSGSISLQG